MEEINLWGWMFKEGWFGLVFCDVLRDDLIGFDIIGIWFLIFLLVLL
jgi:hypothetical protein